MLKRIICGLALWVLPLFGQAPTSVTMAVTVDTKTYTIQLTPGAIASLAQYLAAANAATIPALPFLLTILTNQPTVSLTPYTDLGDLIVKHFLMLLGPVVAVYPSAAVAQAATALAAAQMAMQQAVVSAASSPVTVTGQ